jgi:hypothetical protein
MGANRKVSPEQMELQTQTPGHFNPALPVDLDLPSLSQVRTDTVLEWPSLRAALFSVERYNFLDQDGNRSFTYLSNPALHISGETRSQVRATRMSNPSLEKVEIERLVDRFFLYVNTKNPILDRKTVKEYCDELYEQGMMWDLQTCAVLLVCALGAAAQGWKYQTASSSESLHPFKSRFEELEVAKCYYTAAERRLSLALRIPGSLSVQCLCLAG